MPDYIKIFIFQFCFNFSFVTFAPAVDGVVVIAVDGVVVDVGDGVVVAVVDGVVVAVVDGGVVVDVGDEQGLLWPGINF